MSDRPTIKINGREYDFSPGETILDVAARHDIYIPTLCHDPRLDPAGACRTCLVEIDGWRRLAPACATPASDGMELVSENQRIDGDIKLFDADPDGGEIRHRFTISLTKARVSSLTTVSPDVYDAEASSRPIYDLLEITAGTITYTDLVNGVEYTDSATSVSTRASSKRSSKASNSKGKKKKK